MTDKTSRYDKYGEWRWVGIVKGYIVARRKGAHPCCFTENDWAAMSCEPVA